MRNCLLLILLLLSSEIVAQEIKGEGYPTAKVDGMLKSKYEYSEETGKSRFSVRNTRIGVSGDVTHQISYRGQLEISDNGNFKPLDLYASIKPVAGLTFSLGQRTIPLFNTYTVTPSELMFSNRPFIGKYFLGTRDIGIHGQCDFQISTVPASLEIGVYNGSTINEPVWFETPSYGGRLVVGNMKGLRSTCKIYRHNNAKNPDISYLIYAADMRYASDHWKVEAEIMKRDDKVQKNQELLSYYIQGAYAIPLKENYLFKNIVPAARWDGIDQNYDNSGFDINRLTLGLGFGLTKKYFSSILRFDYEHYLVHNRLDIMNGYAEMDSDKFTIELMLKF